MEKYLNIKVHKNPSAVGIFNSFKRKSDTVLNLSLKNVHHLKKGDLLWADTDMKEKRHDKMLVVDKVLISGKILTTRPGKEPFPLDFEIAENDVVYLVAETVDTFDLDLTNYQKINLEDEQSKE